jgi:hypothetical protein
MAIEDREFQIACGELARLLGISLAAARRRVDQRAAAEGRRDRAGRLATARGLVEESRGRGAEGVALFDALLAEEGSAAGFLGDDD